MISIRVQVSLTSVPYPYMITKCHDLNGFFFIIYTVYENSEDIAMSTNVDNVYSNAAQKGQNKQKERGYKVFYCILYSTPFGDFTGQLSTFIQEFG